MKKLTVLIDMDDTIEDLVGAEVGDNCGCFLHHRVP